MAQKPRAWQRMLSGRRLDLLDPSPMDVEIEDIAHGLARVARWNGQTHGPHAFSVAQHCVVVTEILLRLDPAATRAAQLTALLHDAPEYVIGDLISPFKNAVGFSYRSFEDKLMAAILIRFSLPPKVPEPLRKLVKKADILSAYCEAMQLAGFSEADAKSCFGSPPKNLTLPVLKPLSTTSAEEAFLDCFSRLFVEEPS